MKKGKDISIGWESLLKPVPVCPKGYSRISDIAKKLNMSMPTVKKRMDEVGITAIKGKTETGQLTTFYKD